jgi:hypothetical protein
MAEYKSEREMFKMLQVLKILPKGAVSDGHWCQWSGWEMLAVLAGCVAKEELGWLRATNFFSLSCDEATTKDKRQFLSVTAYIVQNWARVPVFVALKDIKGACAEDLQKLIMEVRAPPPSPPTHARLTSTHALSLSISLSLTHTLTHMYAGPGRRWPHDRRRGAQARKLRVRRR